MNLQQTILNECREEVATGNGFTSWADFCETPIHRLREPYESERAATELALDRQAEFYRWASLNGYVYSGKDKWRKPFHSGLWTELELYNIWREGK